MRAAVVGHVEWVRLRAGRARARAGRDRHSRGHLGGAGGRRSGRGRRARASSARRSTSSSPLGNDELGRRARDAARASSAAASTRRCATSRSGARSPTSTTTASGRSRSWARSCTRTAPTRCRGTSWPAWTPSTSPAGDPDALRAARQARVLVATARELPTLRVAQVQLDALVRSGHDPSESYEPGQLDPAPQLSRLDRWGARAAPSRRRPKRSTFDAASSSRGRSSTPTAPATPSPQA